jgi:hypothetical protein
MAESNSYKIYQSNSKAGSVWASGRLPSPETGIPRRPRTAKRLPSIKRKCMLNTMRTIRWSQELERCVIA